MHAAYTSLPWVLAFHVIFMVTWFAGLFYLPRLFVYHAMTEDAAGNDRFKIMERKLFFGIMTPGAIFTIALGLWMLADNWPAYARAGWLHAKLALVALLVVYHLACGKWLMDFRHDRNRHSHVYYRWMNELPVFALIGIVLLVMLKPF
ncbi:protoporphyrinogen oxidase HemJ [Thiohalobacter sp.]|uniref:protoporphyrinogen oxidase HemJ n=1 Tax=Thiohalobacter sp. TaxID=2025948 RepID=UPI0026339F61|nr:protoporphyrinogen oxidase HemJ [Thiohalobacter sp.]